MQSRPFIGCLLAVSLTAGACSVIDGGEEAGCARPVPVNLSLGVGGATRTKASGVPEMESAFGGMTAVRILPFSTGVGVKVASGNMAKSQALTLRDISGGGYDTQAYDGTYFHGGLLEKSLSHLYSSTEATLPVGTTAALVYGKAIPVPAATEREGKRLNGSLQEEGWEVQAANHFAGDIAFSPDPIYDDDAATAASQVAELLSGITSVSYSLSYYYYSTDHYESSAVSLPWNADIADPSLKAAFDAFVGGGALIPGDGRLLEHRLGQLRLQLEGFTSSDETPLMHGDRQALHAEDDGTPVLWKELYNGLREALLARLDALDRSSYAAFPLSEGLPAGAALFRWDGARFIPVPDNTGALLSAGDYCYMPPLYYYVNTIVYTSTNSYIYNNFPEKTWAEILRMYTAGHIVTYETRSAALQEPLQYACGRLKATLKSSVQKLQDNDGDPETMVPLVYGTEFPLTGIVLGGQFRQRFNFTPVTDEEMDAVYREYFMYDNQLSGIFLTNETSAPFLTLSLPTPRERDVYFALEFRNDSSQDFYGADGLVPRGCTFYLVGKLEPPSAEGLDRALMADHSTTLICTVTSLENARLTIPRMGTPELLLGVQTQTTWDFTPSSYVVLE